MCPRDRILHRRCEAPPRGVGWITTDSLCWLLTEQQYTHTPPLAWAAFFGGFPWLCRLLAGVTVALELSYPLALFFTCLRPWLVLGVIALQLAIHLFMGINYLAFLVANVVWVDWAALGAALRDRRAAARRMPPNKPVQLTPHTHALDASR